MSNAESVQVCAYCHGMRLDGVRTVIYATRFQPGQEDGTVIAYCFCDDSCRQAWVDRPAQHDGLERPE